MNSLLRKCLSCNIYTFKKQCPRCRADTVSPRPASFSPDDKYVVYRIAERYKEDTEG